jgi:transposase InsO family protein
MPDFIVVVHLFIGGPSSRPKVELIYAKNYRTIQEAKSGVFAYIEIFYNRKRRHSANDGMCPVAYEEKAAVAA